MGEGVMRKLFVVFLCFGFLVFGVNTMSVKASEVGSSLETSQQVKGLMQGKVTFEGHLPNQSTSAYYSFTLDKRGIFTLGHGEKKASLDISIYNNDTGQLIEKGIIIHNSGEKMNLGLTPGNYYAVVKGYNSTATYSLEFSFLENEYFELEGNNDFETATPIKPNGTYYGSVSHLGGYYDYYMFNLDEKSKVSFMRKREGQSREIILYDKNREQIGKTKFFGNHAVSANVDFDLEAGQYFILIKHSSVGGGSSGKTYTFNISTNKFKDVNIDYWAFEEIMYLNNKGIINGDSTTQKFNPNNDVTRAQAAIMVSKALKLNTSNVKNPGFNDVKTNHPAYKEIAAVVNAGILPKGSTFNPNKPLTRVEMAGILVEAYKLEGQYSGKILDIKDAKTHNYVSALVANNITKLYTDNTFRPNDKITRADFSVFYARVLSEHFREGN